MYITFNYIEVKHFIRIFIITVAGIVGGTFPKTTSKIMATSIT